VILAQFRPVWCLRAVDCGGNVFPRSPRRSVCFEHGQLCPSNSAGTRTESFNASSAVDATSVEGCGGGGGGGGGSEEECSTGGTEAVSAGTEAGGAGTGGGGAGTGL